jgi:hypothetical protein
MWMISVRKNAAHKESSREKSHVHRAKFNGRPKLPGWLGGKMAQQRIWARGGFYENGKIKEVSACTGVSGRGGAVLERGNLFKGRAVLGSFSSEV